jgi:hypothetical protein
MTTKRDALTNGIQAWMIRLNEEPGWKEWSVARTGHAMFFDDPLIEDVPSEYVFRSPLDKEHAVVVQYLGIQQTANALRACEYYFRRYPFRGLPVTRHEHLTNICEMYFSRFYELRERVKKYMNAVAIVIAPTQMDIGGFIRQFDREFDSEIRARNTIHHHERFDDLGLSRLFLNETIIKQAERKDYRRLANHWATRVRNRSAKVDEVVEAVADATLQTCAFLTVEN